MELNLELASPGINRTPWFDAFDAKLAYRCTASIFRYQKPMSRGSKFEKKIGDSLHKLCNDYPEYAQVTPQFPVVLASGRRADIDFKLHVKFAHENQNYYFELQSRNKHGHELVDKIEAVRRDTQLKTFSFVHEAPLEASVAKELTARNVICYDCEGFSRFLAGIELQVLQLRRAQELVAQRQQSGDSRLTDLVRQLAESEGKRQTRELCRPQNASNEQSGLANEIIREIVRNPDEAIRQARKLFKF